VTTVGTRLYSKFLRAVSHVCVCACVCVFLISALQLRSDSWL